MTANFDGYFSENDFSPIPKFFESTTKGKPFEICSYCEESLENKNYIIEKLIQDDEPIVEFSLCTKCIEGLIASLSKESLEKMRSSEDQLHMTGDDICISCKKGPSEAKRSIHMGMFAGSKYLKDSHIWTCSSCIKEKQKNLSQKTRERLEEFNRDILSPFNSDVPFDLMPI